MAAAYQDAVRSAVAASRNTSERISETIVIANGASTYTLTISGSFDMGADKGALAVDLSGKAHMDEVFAGTTVCLRGPGGPGRKWAKTVRDQAQAHFILRAPLNDPEFVLQQIAAMDQVSKGAPSKVDGVSATHYSGTLGLAPLTLRMAASTRRDLTEVNGGLGALDVDADVWVDPAGRVVRTRTYFNLENTSVTATMTLSDIGRPVTVAVPTDSAVTPAASIGGPLPG